MAPGADVVKMGVLRSHAVRHGPGPLPTETQALTPLVPDHNQLNDWQGAVRYGWFDPVLSRYALDVTGGVDEVLITHMDILPRLNTWQYCAGYEGLNGLDDLPVDITMKDGLLSDFNLPAMLSLDQRAQFTQVLSEVQPVIESCAADEGTVILKMEALLGRPVEMVSRGARAGDVEMLKGIPE